MMLALSCLPSRELELSLVDASDVVVVVSQVERDIIKHYRPRASVGVMFLTLLLHTCTNAFHVATGGCGVQCARPVHCPEPPLFQTLRGTLWAVVCGVVQPPAQRASHQDADQRHFAHGATPGFLIVYGATAVGEKQKKKRGCIHPPTPSRGRTLFHPSCFASSLNA